MKKKFALLLSFVAIVAFVSVNVANAQCTSVKAEQTVEKKASEPCCESKGTATAAAKEGCCSSGTKAVQTASKEGCCSSGTKATTTATTAVATSGCCTAAAKAAAAEARGTEAKAGCGSAGKTCGGCSSKTGTQQAEATPVPRR